MKAWENKLYRVLTPFSHSHFLLTLVNSITLRPSCTKATIANTQFSETSRPQHIKLLKTRVSRSFFVIFSPLVIKHLRELIVYFKSCELTFAFYCTRASKWKKFFVLKHSLFLFYIQNRAQLSTKSTTAYLLTVTKNIWILHVYVCTQDVRSIYPRKLILTVSRECYVSL